MLGRIPLVYVLIPEGRVRQKWYEYGSKGCNVAILVGGVGLERAQSRNWSQRSQARVGAVLVDQRKWCGRIVQLE